MSDARLLSSRPALAEFPNFLSRQEAKGRHRWESPSREVQKSFGGLHGTRKELVQEVMDGPLAADGPCCLQLRGGRVWSIPLYEEVGAQSWVNFVSAYDGATYQSERMRGEKRHSFA